MSDRDRGAAEQPDPWRRALEAAFARYEDTRELGDHLALAQARLVLCQVLREGGWHAPEVVVGQMLRDHARVAEQATGVHAPPVVPLPRRAVSPVPDEQPHAFAR
ncbi:MAG: hypothetical protein Q8R60_11415 [Mycobacteriales bacterium]|nr:hypothetical protein [Mycobacteriales bacterium]